MHSILKFILKSIRKIYTKFYKHNWRDESNVLMFDQKANDYIRTLIEKNTNGLMICKFGTIELDSFCCCLRNRQGLQLSDYCNYIKGKYSIFPEDTIKALSNNAGFFPAEVDMEYKYMDLVEQDIKQIDVLASYIDQEEFIADKLDNCIKVNLDGYYAPFRWDNPWTKALENKNVLVIHPFSDSIEKQYQKREYLFDDKSVLPKFKSLHTIKAVQSIAGNGPSTGFTNWFEALEYMKNEMDTIDYEIVLVGCGAYGMHLAAHAKRKGKIAIHLAGWTQMLFGIYGNRWISDQPEYSKYVNEYWVRPSEIERPQNASTVENACYW